MMIEEFLVLGCDHSHGDMGRHVIPVRPSVAGARNDITAHRNPMPQHEGRRRRRDPPERQYEDHRHTEPKQDERQ